MVRPPRESAVTAFSSGGTAPGHAVGRRLRSKSLGRRRLWAIGLAALTVASSLAVVWPTFPVAIRGGSTRGGGEFGAFASSAPLNISLAVNHTAINLSNEFWGSTVNNEVRLLRGETDAVNATPARVLVWPGAMAGEDYDPITNTHWGTYNGTPIHGLTSEKQFVAMCKATRCQAIMQVPAEIDNPSYAEKIVNYTEVNLSFTPAFWMIGNEPELWYHWQQPWKDWAYSGGTQGPTPTQFGHEVVSYVKAIRQVDNTTPILGLPASGCTCGFWTFSQWISGVLNVTGPLIQAVAFHEYPAGWLGTGDGSLSDFYYTLQGDASIPVRMLAARQAVTTSCPKCNVSVFISEIGSALSWSAYGQYAAGFSGALSLAAQFTQAMDDNLTNVDLFATELGTYNSWFNPHGGVRPDYTLYTQVLSHLGTEAFPVTASGPGHSVYAIDTIAPGDHGRRDLLIANDNVSRTVTFRPAFAGDPSVAPVAAWYWNGSVHTTSFNQTTWVEPFTAEPIPEPYPSGLPANFTLPPQSMVLFESYPSGASYVTVREHGVPQGVPWYAGVNGVSYRSLGANLSLLLPPGSYGVSSAGIPLPLGGKEHNATERLGPFPTGPLLVQGNSSNVSIDFVPQWRINASASPTFGGTVHGGVGWWNASQPLGLSVTGPALGYAFSGWSGFGPGSYNGSNRSITVTPTGPITEKARFVAGMPIRVVESGLPARTVWSATVRGWATATSGHGLTVYEPNGTYGFSVSEVPGYRAIPRNGSFTVSGAGVVVPVRYVPITPPGPTFPVTFQVYGLPPAQSVGITVRGAMEFLGNARSTFELWNGSYSFAVSYVPGYHAVVGTRVFAVQGGPVAITVGFAPTLYPTRFESLGARAGLNWTVLVNGSFVTGSSAWHSTALPNGTYPYAVIPPANFSVYPDTGVLVVDGRAAVQFPTFTLAYFPSWFIATGAGSAAPWSLRFGNLTSAEWSTQATILAPNGTYTFDVHPPAGYYAVPSHGALTVAGLAQPIVIRFLPTSLQPSAALVAQLTTTALTVSIWMGASAFIGFAVFRSLRRRGEPPR